MDAELSTLADAGAQAIVAAMTADLWQSARGSVLALFQRADRGRRAALEARLDEDAADLGGTASPDDCRRERVRAWARELLEELGQDPSGRAALAQLIRELTDTRLGPPPGERRASDVTQNNTAHGSGTIYAVQHGDLHTSQMSESDVLSGRRRSESV
ncbi:hypothetical protein [Streptomyces sp. NPDC090445]|uniref:hypothetical protein n=1 Tax=Streptomyces sp. NPDC090445 TaxID=3365963 RepID=UPI0037F335CE